MLSETDVKLNLDDRIGVVMSEIVKDGNYPRAVKLTDLVRLGLVSKNDQFAFCKVLISDPKNKHGRVLIISRQTNSEHPDGEEKISPVDWFARGSENKLGESFIVPHMEPKGNRAEILKLKEGKAILVLHSDEHDVYSCKFIKMEIDKPYTVRTGQIHSILCVSPIVHLFELKVVGSNHKIYPNFALKEGLVNEKNVELSGFQVDKYLANLHSRADASFLTK